MPLEEIKRVPGGAEFPGEPIVVAPKDPDCTDRLDIGNLDMMGDGFQFLDFGSSNSPDYLC